MKNTKYIVLGVIALIGAFWIFGSDAVAKSATTGGNSTTNTNTTGVNTTTNTNTNMNTGGVDNPYETGGIYPPRRGGPSHS